MAMLPQILFIIGLTGLLVLLVTTCIKFTKGALDTAAWKKAIACTSVEIC